MKNIKKAFIIIMAVVVICAVCTACRGADTADTENTTTEAAASSTTEEELTDLDMFVFDVGELINYAVDGKPIVEISCDEKEISLSYDLSEMEDDVIDVTIEEEMEADDYFYVTMAGNVTDHTLMSDGALFDGVAEIENGKAVFSVTYDNEKTFFFVIRIPNIAA